MIIIFTYLTRFSSTMNEDKPEVTEGVDAAIEKMPSTKTKEASVAGTKHPM